MYNWGLVPVLERMRRLNGEGAPLLAHQVYTAMRELLHQLEDVDLQSVVECFQNIKPSTAHVEGAFSLMGAIIGQRRSLLSTNSSSDVFFVCPWNGYFRKR